MQKHAWTGLWWCLLVCLALLGCGKTGDDKVHITYWEKWTGSEAEAMQAVVDAFNRSQDRIVVEYLAVSQADQKTLLATAGGDPPDLAGLQFYNIYSFADNAALTPLDPYVERDRQTVDGFMSRYYPVFANMCRYGGTLWALPSAPAVVALHWNKALFREAGLDPERPPQTVAELDLFAEKLTKRDAKTGELKQLGFLPGDLDWYDWAYPQWFGSELLSDDHITLDTPQARAAYDWVESYSRKYGLATIRTFAGSFGKFSSPQSPFFAGKIAMQLQGPWLHDYIRQYAPGLEYGVAAWPTAPGGPSDFALADADVLVIPRGSKHPDEAWEFIKYATSANTGARRQEDLTGMELLCYRQGKTSALKEWSPFFEQHHPHPYIDVFRQLGSSGRAATIARVGIWKEYQEELTEVFNEVRLLSASPTSAIEHGQARMAASWADHQKSLERRGAVHGIASRRAPEP